MSDAQQPQAPARLQDLKRKMKLTGTVTKVELYGAFVDVGVGRDGLVHISALSLKPVNRVEDVLKEGDTVTVWVRKADPQTGRIDLTLIEPLAVEWEELRPGQSYTGKVVKLEKFGAFVDIGAERPGLVHISELAAHHVDEVGQVVKVGEEVRVKVLAADPRKKQIKLSMKGAEQAVEEALEAENEGAPRTAMQVALERAMAQSAAERRATGRRQKSKADRGRQDLEDILSRTLANKRK